MIESDKIKLASQQLASLSTEAINELLKDMANALEAGAEEILVANERDLSRMDSSDPKYDRLRLTHERLSAIASDCRNVASLPSPLGRILSQRTMPNGLEISRVSVPFGVIGVIYEARPNVTLDVTALCLKAGSAVILKGGSDAIYAGHELYNDAVKRVASAADVQMIYVSNAFHDTQKYLCVDGIHPNKAGQEKIAKTIVRAIV